jgi:hypothetical protein
MSSISKSAELFIFNGFPPLGGVAERQQHLQSNGRPTISLLEGSIHIFSSTSTVFELLAFFNRFKMARNLSTRQGMKQVKNDTIFQIVASDLL